MISEHAGAASDLKLTDNQVIHFGNRHITVLATPGHTNVSTCSMYSVGQCTVLLLGNY